MNYGRFICMLERRMQATGIVRRVSPSRARPARLSEGLAVAFHDGESIGRPARPAATLAKLLASTERVLTARG